MTVTQFALATGLSWPERFSTAGSVTLLGMLAIFCVLAVLWATIEIMHAVLNKGHKQSKQPKQPKQPKEKKEPKKTAKENLLADLCGCTDDIPLRWCILTQVVRDINRRSPDTLDMNMLIRQLNKLWK